MTSASSGNDVAARASPYPADEFETELFLGPEHHRGALQKRNHGGLDGGRIAAYADARHRAPDIALVIKRDRNEAIRRADACGAVAPGKSPHPADLDGLAGGQRPRVSGDAAGSGDPAQLLIIGNAGRAIAESDLGPDT